MRAKRAPIIIRIKKWRFNRIGNHDEGFILNIFFTNFSIRRSSIIEKSTRAKAPPEIPNHLINT
jgi:hypothetical protein